ncbi:MAG: phosphodiesterase [Pseudomonadota bacterium]
MKLIQITDIHLRQNGELVSGRDPFISLQAARDDILRRHSDADLIVITGDLADDGSAGSYALLRETMAPLRTPLALLLGNHDNRERFLQVFPERRGEGGFVHGMHEVSNGRALFLDTLDEGAHGGRLCSKRLSWFEAQLAAGDGPYWVFMHHNPVPSHLALLDRIMLQDREAFWAIIARYRERIAHIFHGHLHLPMSGALHGVPVSCVRGTAHAGFPNYGEDRLLPHSDLPESYAVIISDGPATTVMMVEYGLHVSQPQPQPLRSAAS